MPGGGGAYDNATKQLITILTRLIKKIKVQSVLSIDKSFIVNSVVCYYDVCRMIDDEDSDLTRHRSIVLPKINKSITQKMPILWQLNILINSQMT